MQRFVEKPPQDRITTNMINAGIYILEPEVLRYLPAAKPVSFERFLFPLLLEKGEPFLSYPSGSYWIDIGTPEKYRAVQIDLLTNKAPIPAGFEVAMADPLRYPQVEGAAVIGPSCDISPGARVVGPTVIGSGCCIGEGAVVSGAILWQNTVVEGCAELSDCVVASGCRVGTGSRVQADCVLGDNVAVGRGNWLKSIKVWPDVVIKDRSA